MLQLDVIDVIQTVTTPIEHTVSTGFNAALGGVAAGGETIVGGLKAVEDGISHGINTISQIDPTKDLRDHANQLDRLNTNIERGFDFAGAVKETGLNVAKKFGDKFQAAFLLSFVSELAAQVTQGLMIRRQCPKSSITYGMRISAALATLVIETYVSANRMNPASMTLQTAVSLIFPPFEKRFKGIDSAIMTLAVMRTIIEIYADPSKGFEMVGQIAGSLIGTASGDALARVVVRQAFFATTNRSTLNQTIAEEEAEEAKEALNQAEENMTKANAAANAAQKSADEIARLSPNAAKAAQEAADKKITLRIEAAAELAKAKALVAVTTQKVAKEKDEEASKAEEKARNEPQNVKIQVQANNLRREAERAQTLADTATRMAELQTKPEGTIEVAQLG